MNVIEALQALKEGKKVQYKGGVIFKYENKHIINMNGDHTALIYNNLEDDSWSIYQEPLLTDSEREYLEYVLRPYKNNIKYIQKSGICNDEHIYVQMKVRDDYMTFPDFKKETRYIGMKKNVLYRPKELGLWKD